MPIDSGYYNGVFVPSNAPPIQHLLSRLMFLEQERRMWEDEWKLVAEFVYPRKGLFPGSGERPGAYVQRGKKILDSVGPNSLRVLGAGMQGGLTSPSRPWHRLGIENKDKMRFGPVKRWLEQCTEIMLAELGKSNFYNVSHSGYMHQAAFGTASAFVQYDDEVGVLRFLPQTAGEFCYACNQWGEVDTLYRRVFYQRKQLIQMFGVNSMSEEMRRKANEQPYEFEPIIHIIQPRLDRDPAFLDKYNMPWESLWIDPVEAVKAVNERDSTKGYLRVDGQEMFQVLAPRWDAIFTEVYGRGPGIDNLPDILMLQQMQKDEIMGLQKMMDPPVNVPSGYKKRVNTLPGGVNETTDGTETIRATYQINIPIQYVEQKIDKLRMMIREGFYNDMFMMVLERPNMTATEVIERHEEKLLLLGPVIERQLNEFLDPLIRYTFALLRDAGKLPPPPKDISDEDSIKVEYISMLAQAQQLTGTQSIQSGLQFVGQIAAAKQDPSAWDMIDTDEAILQFGGMTGMPQAILKSKEDAQRIRTGRMQELQQQRAMSQAQQGADVAATLGQIDLNQNTPLAQLGSTLGQTPVPTGV